MRHKTLARIVYSFWPVRLGLGFITDNSYPDREQVSETDNSSI